MKLKIRIIAIAVSVGIAVPFTARGQTALEGRPVSLVLAATAGPYPVRAGISRPTVQAVSRSGLHERDLAFSSTERDDTAHFSRTHHVIVGALIGAAVGLGTGLIADHMAKSAGPGSGEQVTYTFAPYTTPIGLIIGALIGLLIPPH